MGVLLSFHNRNTQAKRSRSPPRLNSEEMAEAEPRTRNLSNLDQTPIIPLSGSIFVNDDDFSGDTSSYAVITGDKDLHFITRPSKRRKSYPFTLDRLEDLTPDSNRSFSFTFDTKSEVFALEITPKFGSFNLTKREHKSQKLGDEIREEKSEKIAEEHQEGKKKDIAEADGKAVTDLSFGHCDLKYLSSWFQYSMSGSENQEL